MANISSFTDLSGNTYNLKDADAREALGKYFALDGGTVIPSGDDLDDYKTPGTYTCASVSAASGIANTPLNVAFRMVVMRVNSGTTTARLFQIVFPNGFVRFYLRYYGGSSWSTWRLFSANLSDLDGVVGIDHGGTGETTAEDAMKAFFDGLTDENIASNQMDCIMVQPLEMDEQYVASLGTPKRRPLSSLWSFIKGKVIDRYGQTDLTCPTWVRGAISSTTGAATSSTTRLRTNIFYPIDKELGLDLYVPEGFQAYVHGYSNASESSFSGPLTDGWQTGSIMLRNVSARFVRLVLAKTGGGTITVAEAPSDLSFYRPMATDTMLSANDSTLLGYGKAADAGAVRDILGLKRELGMTGIDSSYDVGDYVVVGTQMYRVTAAVAAGGTLTPGTNVTATTILGEIARLASS